jgi:HlyD family secretion protein
MNTEKKINLDVAKTLMKNLISARSNRLKYWLIGIVSAVIILIVIGIKSNGSGGSMQFKTEQAKPGDITVIVTATGTLQPTNEVEVGSEVSGIIKSIEVNYNDKVKVGQILAKLDTSTLEAKVSQSKADLESAKANVLQQQATLKEAASKIEQYKKARELSNNKVPSQLEYDAAEASLERAKANCASAEAAISKAQATLLSDETNLSKAVICSPIDGMVLTREVEPGQTVAASFETPVLFTLAEDLTQMELHVDVDEADIGQVKVGQDATFTVDAYPNKTFNAQITQVRYGSETTDGVVTYETVLTVDNNDLSLRPGMTATADIVVTKVKNAVTVSNSALRFKMTQEDTSKNSSNNSIVNSLLPHPPKEESKQKETTISSGSQQTVYVLKDGQPVAVSITTGVTDGVTTEVLNGEIKPGMSLIVGTITKEK